MIWVELLLHTPGYVGHQARAALARRRESAGKDHLPAAFFHYRENGPVPNAPPPIRILADGRKVRVLGIGDAGAELLLTNARRVVELLRDPASPVPSYRISEGRFEAQPEGFQRRHTLRSFVVQLPRPVRERLKAGEYEHPDVAETLKRKLTEALERQMAWLTPDVDVPEPAAVTINRSVPVAVRDGRFFIALDLEFTAPVLFAGPWQLGRLQARGYGRLRTLRGGAS